MKFNKFLIISLLPVQVFSASNIKLEWSKSYAPVEFSNMEGNYLKKLPKNLRSLAEVQIFLDQEEWAKSLTKVRALWGKYPELQHWLLHKEIKALNGLIQSGSNKLGFDITWKKIEKNKIWLYEAENKSSLHDETYDLAKNVFNRNKLFGKKRIEEVLAFVHKQSFYKTHEEVELLERASNALYQLGAKTDSLYLMLEAYKKSPRRYLLNQITKLEKQLKLQVLEEKDKVEIHASLDEEEIYASLKELKRKSQWVEFTKAGVAFLKKYPISQYSETVTKQLISGLLIQYGSGEEKGKLRKDIIAELLKADSEFLFSWGKRAYYRGRLVAALKLFKEADSKGNMSSEQKAENSFWLASSAYYLGEWESANTHFQRIIDNYPKSEFAEEALFKIGLSEFRNGNFDKAVIHFERLVSFQGLEKHELSVLYWLWKSLEKVNSEAAEEIRIKLVEKFPVSYYGLLAIKANPKENAKENENLWFKKDFNKNVSCNLSYVAGNKKKWENWKILVGAAWFKEAQRTFDAIRFPQDNDCKLIQAKLYSESGDYLSSMKILSELWEKDKSYLAKQTVSLIYPSAFQKPIETNAQKYNIDKDWIRSLIRQESAFDPHAISSSNAHGLMQLIPSTAKEVSRSLGWKRSQVIMNLHDPEKNIQLGSLYLRRLLNRYDDHLPMALASYNAGLGKLRRWLRYRVHQDPFIKEKELHLLSKLKSGEDPIMEELWVEELPWSETRYYVKAILRNIALYKSLENGVEKLPYPIWK